MLRVSRGNAPLNLAVIKTRQTIQAFAIQNISVEFFFSEPIL